MKKKVVQMNRVPFKSLHFAVRKSIIEELLDEGHATVLPYSVRVKGENQYNYYIQPRPNCYGFVIEVNLQTKRHSKHIGNIGGNRNYGTTIVDTNSKKKEDTRKDEVIIKGYVDRTPNENGVYVSRLIDVEVIFHPNQIPKSFPELHLNSRERRILLCFGQLKGTSRSEALARLSVTKEEIDNLVKKGLLKYSKSGPVMTCTGEVNKLELSGNTEAAIDQW